MQLFFGTYIWHFQTLHALHYIIYIQTDRHTWHAHTRHANEATKSVMPKYMASSQDLIKVFAWVWFDPETSSFDNPCRPFVWVIWSAVSHEKDMKVDDMQLILMPIPQRGIHMMSLSRLVITSTLASQMGHQWLEAPHPRALRVRTMETTQTWAKCCIDTGRTAAYSCLATKHYNHSNSSGNQQPTTTTWWYVMHWDWLTICSNGNDGYSMLLMAHHWDDNQIGEPGSSW